MFSPLSFILFTVCFAVCISNKIYHFTCGDPYIDSFLSCYFNDLIGSIGFAAFADFLLHFCGRALDKYRKVFGLMLFCGVVWEIITPIFRSSTVGDFFDMVVYVLGGTVFYGIDVLYKRIGKRIKKSHKHKGDIT